MSTVVDANTVELVELENILDDTATCRHCSQGATVRIRANCCPREMNVCDSCEVRLDTIWTHTIIRAGSMRCTACLREFVAVGEAITVLPI